MSFFQEETMHALYLLSLYLCVATFFFQVSSTATYVLTPSQSIADGQTLVSEGGSFKLGFFSPPGSNNRYLGIWYNTIPGQTVVWVANRDSPLYDTAGVLKIGPTGNVILLNQSKSVTWSSRSSEAVHNPILEFLQSGNLVLRDVGNGDLNKYLWQSFDYPGDTLLPGMKLGWNLKTGMNRYMSSWRNYDDPSHGDFTYKFDLTKYLEPVMRNGSNKYYRSGPWNGVRFSASSWRQETVFTWDLIHNDEEIYYMYQMVNRSVLSRLVLIQTINEGYLRRFQWADSANSWVSLVTIPRDRCDYYALCGTYSTCDVTEVVPCQCLKGFKPRSPQDWSQSDWSQGCEHETSVNCSRGEGFRKFTGLKLPETTNYLVETTMNLGECRVKCLNNCSCTAYTNSDVRDGGSGCLMWFTDLIDMRQMILAEQDIYIRMAASELDPEANSKRKEHEIKIGIISSIAGVIVLGLGIWCIWRKRRPKVPSEKDDHELPLYGLFTIKRATNNFSEENMLGQGGFGIVYKGKLESGQEIAVKRLSKDSTQGAHEFKNETILISKLQHINLVRLLGCCIDGEEKILVYEYMQNKSLDSAIFDETESRQLDWQVRFDIILGVARGLLYLHHDSRLRIIHRDLKPSNILLDSKMVPKISDFGMARLFGADQGEANTKRVVGTYGYMSPEYAVDGHFSMKSDVFSFGVVVLEIISGTKNRDFSHSEDELNLIGHVWRLWSEARTIELVEDSIRDSHSVEDILRCIHVGLLCVQKRIAPRPTMSSVVLMLSSETTLLPEPEPPGFYIERSRVVEKESSSWNDATITLLRGR